MIQKLLRLNFSRWVVGSWLSNSTDLGYFSFVFVFHRPTLSASQQLWWWCWSEENWDTKGQHQDTIDIVVRKKIYFQIVWKGWLKICGYNNTSWASTVAASLGSIRETTFLHCYNTGKHLLYAKVEKNQQVYMVSALHGSNYIWPHFTVNINWTMKDLSLKQFK